MIPLRDDNPTTRTPVVTWSLIAACVLVFLLQNGTLGGGEQDITFGYALIPERVFAPDHRVVVEVPTETGRIERVTVGPSALAQWLPGRAAEWLTLLTCVFLHGGWLHLLGNVWVLFIFGDNVEDRFGRLVYLVFYLVCGVGASAAHLLSAPDSALPTVGASGAIAGVMGAYFLLHPNARVLTLIPLGFFLYTTVLPAWVFLGFWFAIQFLSGVVDTGAVGGVAWWAHVGGFALGLAVTAVLRVLGLLRPPAQALQLRAYRARRRGPDAR